MSGRFCFEGVTPSLAPLLSRCARSSLSLHASLRSVRSTMIAVVCLCAGEAAVQPSVCSLLFFFSELLFHLCCGSLFCFCAFLRPITLTRIRFLLFCWLLIVSPHRSPCFWPFCTLLSNWVFLTFENTPFLVLFSILHLGRLRMSCRTHAGHLLHSSVVASLSF